MISKRFFHVDFLRAISILGVIAIHTYYYNLTSDINRFIWNYLNFVVVAFIFCSGYVSVSKSPSIYNISHLFSWYKKRFLRLLIPYYLYLLVHYGLIFFLPHLVSGLDLKFNISNILKSIFLIGGANLSWLPLLFVELTLVFPFLIAVSKNKTTRLLFLCFSLTFSLFLTVYGFSYNYYKLVMWIPYSLVLWFAIASYTWEQHKIPVKNYLFTIAGSGVVWIFLTFIWQQNSRPSYFIDNKYPPNFYYLSYSIFASFLLLFLASYIPKWEFFKNLITFISSHSYSLFFIHYILLDIFQTNKQKFLLPLNAFFEYLLIVFLSLLSVFAFSNIKKINYK